MRCLTCLFGSLLMLAGMPAGAQTAPDTAPKRVTTRYAESPEAMQKAKLGSKLEILLTVRGDGAVAVDKLQSCEVFRWGKRPSEDLEAHCTAFYDAATDAMQHWRYRPADGDRPGEVQVQVSLVFGKKQPMASIEKETLTGVTRPDESTVTDARAGL